VSNKIHLTVATLVTKAEKFLMVSETDRNITVLNQPAGHVEPGENIFDAAIRETLEETGWQVALTDFLGIYTYKSSANEITYYRMCFVAEPVHKNNSQPLDPEIKGVHWMTAEQIRQSDYPHRSPLVSRCLEDYLEGQIFPLEIFCNPL